MFAWADANIHMGAGVNKQPTHTVWVTGETFSTLGVIPARGHVFGPNDAKPGCGTPGALISYSFWQSQFAGSDSVVGSMLVLDDHPTQVIGVTPPRFAGIDIGRRFDIALPLCSLTSYHPAAQAFARKDDSFLTVMGRVKAGWSFTQAASQLSAISPAIFESTVPPGYSPAANSLYKSFRLTAEPAPRGISGLRETYDSALWLLLGITGLVLLLTCVNLANLILARAIQREREIAVRLAIGASARRLVRQLFTESAVLSVLGVILGALIAKGLSKAIVLYVTTTQDAPYLDLGVNWMVPGFLSGIAVVTSLIFGLVPAIRGTRIDPADAMKASSRGMTAGHRRIGFQQASIVAQIAMSLVLVAGAALFVRSFNNLMKIDPGFLKKGIAIASIDLSRTPILGKQYEPFLESLLEGMRLLPEVQSAAISTHVPLDGSSWSLGVRVGDKQDSSKYTWVSPSYFGTMETPFIVGRDFDHRDTSNSPPVAIVNQTFANRFLKGTSPIGKVIETASEPNYPATGYEIVGVVRDARYADLRESIPPQAFAPLSQYPALGRGATVFIRTTSVSRAIPEVRAKLAEMSPQIRAEFIVFASEIEDSLVCERLMAVLSGFFGIVALLLATTGLYGVISYAVASRTSEIGIRLALGASRGVIVTRILREAFLLVAVGTAIGLAVTFAASRFAGSLLFGLKSNDLGTIEGATLLLIFVVFGASWIPAQRALHLEPTIALRYE